MRKLFVSVFALLLILSVSVGAGTCQAIEIEISPKLVNLQSNGEWLTVHADIPYAIVVPGTVTLDGFSADVETADLQGNLVAKFDLDTMKDYLKDFLEAGSVTMTLSGDTTGGSFSGSDVVRVIDAGGKRERD